MADPEVKTKLEQPAAKPEEKPATEQPPQTDAGAAKPGRQRDARGRFVGKNAPRAEPTAVSQAEIDATQKRLGVDQFSDSIIKKGKTISENSISHTDKMMAVNRGLQRGLANPFAGIKGGNDEVPSKELPSDIVDRSGTISVQLIQRVNNLDSAGKSQLFKFLKAKQ